MKIYDLSQPVYDDAPNCPGHPPVQSSLKSSHQNKDGWQLEYLQMSNHTGSHVDAPLHRIPGGASLEDLPLETWAGRAVVADVRPLEESAPVGYALLRETLAGQDLNDAIVLLCTGWGDKRAKTKEWEQNAPFLSHDGADFLVESGVRGVGIDHYSVGDGETHRILLSNGVWIVEELHFTDEIIRVAPSATFFCLPINLKNHSGAWCRPVFVTM